MGSILLIFTLIAIYTTVYWMMAAEKSKEKIHFGFLGLKIPTLSQSLSDKKERKGLSRRKNPSSQEAVPDKKSASSFRKTSKKPTQGRWIPPHKR